MRVPDVSVIVPIHNKAKYLKTCLESVFGQRGVVLEVICIDDASTDGSAGMAAQHLSARSNGTLLRNETRSGAAHSRNQGIEAASGRFVQFTDADELMPEGALESMVFAAARTGADAVRGSLQKIQAGRIAEWPGAQRLAESSGSLIELPDLWIPWFHTCYLISRQLLTSHAIRYPPLIAGEDPVFIALVLTAARRLATIPVATYIYRQDEKRSPPTAQTVTDYLRHAEMVRAAYGECFAACWEAYRPVIQDDLHLLLRQAGLSPLEQAKYEELSARL